MSERVTSDVVLVEGDQWLVEYMMPLVTAARDAVVVARIPVASLYQPSQVLAMWLNRAMCARKLNIVNSYHDPHSAWVVVAQSDDILMHCEIDETNPPFTHRFCMPK
jgi:hypothetical protein